MSAGAHDEDCDLGVDCSCGLDDVTAIRLALETLEEYRDAIDSVVADLTLRAASLEERAMLGDTLDRLRRTVDSAAAWANDRLVASMNARRLDRLDDLPGVAPVERYANKARRGWDNEAVRSNAIARLYQTSLAAIAEDGGGAVDPDTGERVPGWPEAVQAISEVWNLSGANSRITALKALGLDPDEYCTPGKTTWNVRYVRDES